MKTRTGLVSNSSSTAFICDVCNKVETGYDKSASEFDMAECNRGHMFCISHMKDREIDDYENEDESNEVPEDQCPICTFQEMYKPNILDYLMKKFELNKSDILAELKGKFAHYGEFIKFMQN